MKKRFLTIGLLILFAAPSFAELTVEDTVSEDYMRNNGYSQVTIKATKKAIARANGETLTEPVEDERYNQPVIKFIRRVFMYTDPALDDHSFMNDHDIKTTPSINDL